MNTKPTRFTLKLTDTVFNRNHQKRTVEQVLACLQESKDWENVEGSYLTRDCENIDARYFWSLYAGFVVVVSSEHLGSKKLEVKGVGDMTKQDWSGFALSLAEDDEIIWRHSLWPVLDDYPNFRKQIEQWLVLWHHRFDGDAVKRAVDSLMDGVSNAHQAISQFLDECDDHHAQTGEEPDWKPPTLYFDGGEWGWYRVDNQHKKDAETQKANENSMLFNAWDVINDNFSVFTPEQIKVMSKEVDRQLVELRKQGK